MKIRYALIALAMMVTGCASEQEVPKVGDMVDGQVVFQVNEDGSFLTAPNTPCLHEDYSPVLPCVWRADLMGNSEGRSYILMPNGDDGEVIYFDEEEESWTKGSR